VAATGVSERFETFVSALRMWFSISVYSPERGYFVAVFGVITERKQAEEELSRHRDHLQELVEEPAQALADSERLLRTVMEVLPVGLWVLDRDGFAGAGQGTGGGGR
jgi:PAS domain-containing protein